MDNPSRSNECSEDTLLVEVANVARLAARELVSADLADDIAHDVVLACLIKLRTGQLVISADAFVGIARQIARHRAIDHLRGRQHRRMRELDFAHEIAESARVWMCPELALRESELSTFHRHTLRRLPRRCRRAFVMVREERTSYKLVAKRLGVSRGVVCADVVTAQRQFRVGLLEQGLAVPPAPRSTARRGGVQ
ncbi:MAG: hypothetical protein JWM41_2055 [Gemmatimonadetes bacterium]|nr:hypothetical protein [Gemmatimonadota bacterium]